MVVVLPASVVDVLDKVGSFVGDLTIHVAKVVETAGQAIYVALTGVHLVFHAANETVLGCFTFAMFLCAIFVILTDKRKRTEYIDTLVNSIMKRNKQRCTAAA